MQLLYEFYEVGLVFSILSSSFFLNRQRPGSFCTENYQNTITRMRGTRLALERATSNVIFFNAYLRVPDFSAPIFDIYTENHFLQNVDFVF